MRPKIQLADVRADLPRLLRRPWSLTGEGWIIPFHAPFSDEPVPLPEGACAPLERGSKADPSGRFHGGLGMVLVVRYASSDGAYPPN